MRELLAGLLWGTMVVYEVVVNSWLRLFGLCLVPLLVHCSDGQANRPCFTSSACGDGAACVQMGSDGFCMPECDFHSECAQGELCLMQRRHRTNPEFRYVSACVSASLEPTDEGVACQERELEACETEPGCRYYSGWRLDLEMRCLDKKPPPAECIGAPALCTNGQEFGENADGELYLFGGVCSGSAVTFIDYDVDHPLYSELFEVQPVAWDWPECEPPASL